MTPRDRSKLAQVIELLGRADGATIVDLTPATGWLPHTTRAALTGLRKRGYAVIRERIGAGDSVYRVSDALPTWEIAPYCSATKSRPRAQGEGDASGVVDMAPASLPARYLRYPV